MILTSKEMKQFTDKCKAKNFKKGDVVLYQGEVPTLAYIVKEGTIKVYNITQNGEEQIVEFSNPGEFFPTPWLFKKAPGSLYYYEALTDIVLYTSSREALLEQLLQNQAILKDVLDHYVTSYVSSMIRITALEQSKASQKILHTLYYLMQRYGKEIVPGVVRIKVDLTHQTIASLVGLSRETTATELSILKKLKVLSYKRQRYLVKKSLLMQLIGEDNFKDVKF